MPDNLPILESTACDTTKAPEESAVDVTIVVEQMKQDDIETSGSQETLRNTVDDTDAQIESPAEKGYPAQKEDCCDSSGKWFRHY
jgi:hypothetical protein